MTDLKMKDTKSVPENTLLKTHCCVGGAKQEFSYANNMEKWTDREIFGERRGNCSRHGVIRGEVTSVVLIG